MSTAQMIQELRTQKAVEKTAIERILGTAEKFNRQLSPNEQQQLDQHSERVRDIGDRLDELTDQALADAQATPNARKYGVGRIESVREPLTYQRSVGNSYFLDLANAQLRNDVEAAGRLQRHAQEMDVEMPRREQLREQAAEREMAGLDRREHTGRGSVFEKRTNPNRTDGQGGYFVPPLWLVDEYVDLPRFGRTLANSVRNLTLPTGTDSVNVPKVATGTATGVQTADAAAVTSQDLTDTFVTAPVRTIAGQQDIAIQLLDQSPASFDEIVFADLIADYNMRLDLQCWTGSGTSGQLKGVLNVSGINAITYTDATPTIQELYAPLMQGVSQSASKRKLPPTAIFMTPSRWYWMASQLDTQGRPLVLPETSSPFNPMALQTGGDVEGPVGRVANLPILADGNIPNNLGAGTNEDRIATMRTSDLYLWEGNMRTRVLQEVLSGTLQVRFQLFNYAAFMPDRRPETISVISGTGVIAPSGF